MEARLAASTRQNPNAGIWGCCARRGQPRRRTEHRDELARRDILDNDGLSGRTSHPLCQYTRRRIISRPGSERH
jgi:hypothetical protein